MTPSRRHDVYRYYDADGVLLYVGISAHALDRLGQHRGGQWWDEVARMDIEHVPDRATAVERETHLIRTLAPRYNIAGTPRVSRKGYTLGPRNERRIAHRTFISELREDQGKSMGQFVAGVDGLSKAHLSRIENGIVQPSPAMLRRIADALGVSLDDISTRADESVAS